MSQTQTQIQFAPINNHQEFEVFMSWIVCQVRWTEGQIDEDGVLWYLDREGEIYQTKFAHDVLAEAMVFFTQDCLWGLPRIPRVCDSEVVAHAIEVLDSMAEPLNTLEVVDGFTVEDQLANLKYNLRQVVDACDRKPVECHPGHEMVITGVRALAHAALEYLSEWEGELEQF
jgi:hypothetical protein